MNVLDHVTLGIVTYNSAEIIKKTFIPIAGIKQKIIVDNNSSDDTINVLRQFSPDTFLIANKENRGFATGCNQIINLAKTKYILLLNPDLYIGIAAISLLLTEAEKYPQAAIIAPVLRYQDGRIQRSFLPFNELVADSQSMLEVFMVEHVIGAAMLINTEMVKRIGCFDEDFFLYGEDEDLCLRVRNAGYRIIIITKAEAVHLYGKSSIQDKNLNAFKYKNLGWARMHIAKKHKGYFGVLKRTLKNIGIHLPLSIIAKIIGKKDVFESSWNTVIGTLGYLLGRPSR
jgi:GT2 family glycosyltransferase